MSLNDYQNMSHEECVELAQSIMSILDGWGLNGKQLIFILALPKGIPTRALRRYREGTLLFQKMRLCLNGLSTSLVLLKHYAQPIHITPQWGRCG